MVRDDYEFGPLSLCMFALVGKQSYSKVWRFCMQIWPNSPHTHNQNTIISKKIWVNHCRFIPSFNISESKAFLRTRPKLSMSLLLLIIINLTLWRTLQNVIQTQKCMPNQKKTALNKCVFKCLAKVSGPTDKSLSSTGNLFQHFGPATAKDLEPHSVLCPGTTRSPRTADLKPETTRNSRSANTEIRKIGRGQTF